MARVIQSLRRNKDKRIYKRSDYGGKPVPVWNTKDFELPGYHNARIIFTNKTTGEIKNWGFLISPSSYSVNKQNNIQMNKTLTGWFITRGGPAIGTLTMSGYFLDSLYAPERMEFWRVYQQYAEDQQNEFLEFVSSFSQKILIEGKYYHGVIQSFSLSKSANQQFLYQYNISFVFYKTGVGYTTNLQDSMSSDQLKTQMGLDNAVEEEMPEPTLVNAQIVDGVVDILSGYNYHDALAASNAITTPISPSLPDTINIKPKMKSWTDENGWTYVETIPGFESNASSLSELSPEALALRESVIKAQGLI